MRLFSTSNIRFYRSNNGYYNSNGEWVEGGTISKLIKGNLQAFGAGEKSFLLPNGRTTSDLRVFFSKEDLNTLDEFDKTKADYCLINGKKYFVRSKEDNTTSKLLASHFKYLLIREHK